MALREAEPAIRPGETLYRPGKCAACHGEGYRGRTGLYEIVPVDDTAYLIATWPGSDPSLGPVVISAHMDVVEARPEDWQRDPFTPVIENGYIYGRGASDTKFEASLVVASLIGVVLAILAYRSVRAQRAADSAATEHDASNTVASIMKADVYALRADHTVLDALQIFSERGISGAPVLNEDAFRTSTTIVR